MGVSKNNGTPKSSILIGFSIINHPFWGTPIFGNTHILTKVSAKVCRHRSYCGASIGGRLCWPSVTVGPVVTAWAKSWSIVVGSLGMHSQK